MVLFVYAKETTNEQQMNNKTMNIKTIMILAVAGALATTAFADEAFDNLVKLSNTPKEQITAANAAQILDAAVAVTNDNALVNIADAKAMTFSDILAKAKSQPRFFDALLYVGKTYGDEADLEAGFQNAVDTWLTLDAETQWKLCNKCFAGWCILDLKTKKYMPVPAVEAAIAKVLASDSTLKANAISQMLYTYGSTYYKDRLERLCEQNFELVKNSILNGQFHAGYQVFDFVTYIRNTKKEDNALVAKLLENIKWFELYGSSTTKKCPYLSVVYKKYEPTLSGLRKQYLESVAKNDFQLTTVALAQDKTDGNKKTTESIYSKLTGLVSKFETALYLSDNDKLVDVLMTIDNSIAPELIEKAVVQINTFDPDYRAADVLKALRVINKKYTLKLYDDRDTWEPILSKVRALIDTYSN